MVMQGYVCYFDVIECAVYHKSGELANYETFQRYIER